LPKYEYIELYNKSERPVSLRNWSLTIGNSVKWISEAIIPAKDYLVLSSIEGADSLAKKSLHKTLGIAGFPQLPHDGNRIVLKNYTGHVISTVSYSLGWYNDSYKAKGGWSLEQIDAENPCGEGSNWKATLNPEGGTPGRKNSVEGRNPDTSLPVPDRITVLDEKTIILYFNKSLDSSGFNRPSLFSIDHNIGQPYAVKAVGPSYKSVVLLIQQALTKGLVYNLSIEADLYDCAGNSSVRTQIPFGIPEPCEKGDIIINEILFDPVSGSAPFLELRNRSSKILALNSLSLAKADPPTHIILSKNILQDDGFLLLPDEYIALTNDPEAIMEHYPMAYKKRVIYMDKFPSLNRSHGEVILLNNKEEEVDNFYYASSMHFQLLKSMKGVSLERRDPNRPTRDSNNWQSAAQQTGFATPGYRNSQDQPLNESTSIVSLDSEIFSPDNDGYNDVLTISLHSSNPNTTASMILFDATGRAVRNLIKNELIGSQSVYTWDGLTDLHEKARIGIYIIWVEIFDVQNGRITIQKLKCVLAEKI
jgi:hypothetical protein